MKQLRSGSFLKCGVSAITMTAHKISFKKSNQIVIILVLLNSLQYRNVEASGGESSSKKTSQPWRAVGSIVSNLTGLGIESQTFGIDSKIF